MLYIYATRSTTSAQNCGCKDETSGAKGRMRYVFSTIYWSSRRAFSLAQQQVLFREKFRSKPASSRASASFSQYRKTREKPSVLPMAVDVHWYLKYPSDILSLAPPEFTHLLWILYRAWNALSSQIFSIKVTWYQTSRPIHIRHRSVSVFAEKRNETATCSASTCIPCLVSLTRTFMTSVFSFLPDAFTLYIPLYFRYRTQSTWGRGSGRELFVIFRSICGRNSGIFYILALCPSATVAEENDGATR